jgi:hypothetical protein
MKLFTGVVKVALCQSMSNQIEMVSLQFEVDSYW